MGKKSNGKLRAQRHFERALRKGVELTNGDPYAYVYATDGTRLAPLRRMG